MSLLDVVRLRRDSRRPQPPAVDAVDAQLPALAAGDVDELAPEREVLRRLVGGEAPQQPAAAGGVDGDLFAVSGADPGPLAAGRNPDPLLKQVQARRSFPTRVIQFAQKTVHDRVLTPLVLRKAVLAKVPLALRLFQRFPILRRIPARLVGLGVRREHIRSPDAGLRRSPTPSSSPLRGS